MNLYYSDPIECPMCEGKTYVKASRPTEGMGYRRNRVCSSCGYKYRTIEILEEEAEIIKENCDGDDNV